MALRLGHRQSEDFDFFSNERFAPGTLLRNISYLREARIDQRGDNTLSVAVERGGVVKVAFFGEVNMNRAPTLFVNTEDINHEPSEKLHRGPRQTRR